LSVVAQLLNLVIWESCSTLRQNEYPRGSLCEKRGSPIVAYGVAEVSIRV